MKQALDSLLSTLRKLENPSKTDDIIKLEENVILLIKDLTSSITENKYSKDDKDLKRRVEELGEIIENLDKNNEQQNKTFAEFMKYLKDRKIN